MKIQQTAYLSLGSNRGNRLLNLQNAVDLIALNTGTVQNISSVYKTASWGFKGPDFLNICLKLSTYLQADMLLEKLLAIEQKLGRIRADSKDYLSRLIDIDILLFDDEVIVSESLNVPHKNMLNRKFVMVPLTEIAPNLIHPITKKTILTDLQHGCSDDSEIEKLDLTINRPVSLVEKYNYIAIEGNIGAGKTSLVKLMSADFNAKTVLERFADNPFLPKFYKDKDRYAFPLEMSFLADRYQQLSDDLAQFDLFKNFIVSDYYIFKSLIFAQVTLAHEEYNLYRRMFDLMYKEITKPDLYVYLYQNTERLLENIKKRGRDYEQDITANYLDEIHQGYSNFIKSEPHLNALIIDISELDFVNNPQDYTQVIQAIQQFEPSSKL
ncbi:MAG: 2-amino-4-hydroxy-6-hydroxymethyldihydropteridine diphosphokinase [Flavobacteriaceae bacterium]|nr:2-amino-4-hydroxy-6-hydroxymethyldihydropteridine diphosphokinase [Flavobacteriaceae bacterium]